MLVRPKVSGPIVVVLVAMAASAVLAGVVGVTGVTATPHLLETTAMIRALAAPAFVVAGVLRLARWRITGESHCGLRGLAMLLMGGISMPSATLARTLSEPSNALATVTCVRALTVGTILYVMAVALSDDAPDRAHLERKIGWLAGTTAAVLVLLALTQHRRLPPEPTLQLGLARGVVLALALGWFTVAIGAVVKGRRDDWAKPLAPLLATMGIAELFRLPARPETALVAVTLTVTVAFLAATAAVVDLVRAAQEENDATQYLSRELADVRGEVVSRDARHDELTHDARSTLAGIRAAMYTLDRHADELDPTTADRLRIATLAELTHLEHMLVGSSLDGDIFDVTEVVRTVTDVRRAAGPPDRRRAAAGSCTRRTRRRRHGPAEPAGQRARARAGSAGLGRGPYGRRARPGDGLGRRPRHALPVRGVPLRPRRPWTRESWLGSRPFDRS